MFICRQKVVLVQIDSKGRGKERLRWLYEAKFVFDCPVLFFFEKSLVISNKSSIFAALEPAKPLYDAQMCGSFCVCTDEQQNTIPETTYQCVNNIKVTRIKKASPRDSAYKWRAFDSWLTIVTLTRNFC